MLKEAAAFTVQLSGLFQVRVIEGGDVEAVLWQRTAAVATLRQRLLSSSVEYKYLVTHSSRLYWQFIFGNIYV